MQKILEKEEILPLTFDIMFTEIFNSEESIPILEEFLSVYLDYELEEVRGNLKILSRRLGRKNRLESRKEVDLLLDYRGKKINIEMSNMKSDGVAERNICYLCKIHGEQTKEGDKDYSRIGEAVQIVFNNFDSSDEFEEICYFKNQKGQIKSQKIKFYVINLVKGAKMCYTENAKTNYLIDFCKLLTETDINKFKKISQKILSNRSAKVLVERTKELSGEDEMVRLFSNLSKTEMEFNTCKKEYEEKYDKEYAEKFENLEKDVKAKVEKEVKEKVEKEVKEKALIESKKETALNMLKENLPIELIQKCTGLSKEDIETLS